MTADEIVRTLGLIPHPAEGGYFAETWRAEEWVTGVPGRYGGRDAGTAIYYLLTPDTFSALHMLASDEVFHFYAGDPVEQLQLFPDGTSRVALIGDDFAAGQRPQQVVPAGVWQGARLAPGGSRGWALMGCTVAPGFDFADYEHGDRATLEAGWPQHRDRIAALT